MERYGYCIFCDEIRNESGGKLSFIGCYNAVMFVGRDFPLSLPKFCIHFYVFSPATQPYTSVVARCYIPGVVKPISEEPIDVPTLEGQLELVRNLPKDTSVPPYIVVAASLVFTPLKIQKPGMINIRVAINGSTNELHLGSLSVERLLS